jgi:hypothetical protein
LVAAAVADQAVAVVVAVAVQGQTLVAPVAVVPAPLDKATLEVAKHQQKAVVVAVVQVVQVLPTAVLVLEHIGPVQTLCHMVSQQVLRLDGLQVVV